MISAAVRMPTTVMSRGDEQPDQSPQAPDDGTDQGWRTPLTDGCTYGQVPSRSSNLAPESPATTIEEPSHVSSTFDDTTPTYQDGEKHTYLSTTQILERETTAPPVHTKGAETRYTAAMEPRTRPIDLSEKRDLGTKEGVAWVRWRWVNMGYQKHFRLD